MNMNNAAFSVGWAARLLGLTYTDAIRLFKREQALVITADEHLGIPAPWLLRFKVYRDRLHEQRAALFRSSNYDLPYPRTSLYMGYREIERSLPYNFLYDPHHHEHRLLQILAPGAPELGRGGIKEKQHLKALVLDDRLRGRPGSHATLRLLVNDLEHGRSWASPAEASWCRGAGLLLDLLLKRWKMEEMDPREPMAPAERTVTPADKKMRGATAEAGSGWPRTELVLVQPQEERYVSTSPHFDFEPGGLGSLRENKEAYLATLPVAFLEAAYADAAAWDMCLCEERTGYRRSIEGMAEEVFLSKFAETEALIYGNRKAWEDGVLAPLLPADFSFLF